ncbi:hypothetical protein [Kitasatospora sp. NPDC056184]|uniref:hypothetical protein n=1 Tax=Kitasatospora sp. NPDC056184 TaxID=3345738 RepID=UPI0035DED81B
MQVGGRGWELAQREPDGWHDGLVAIDAEALHERLAAGETFTDPLVANDSWRITGPTNGRHLQVVTGPHHEWRQARVVDIHDAHRVSGPGLAMMLVTRCGRYPVVEHDGELAEIDGATAARLVYRLPETWEDRLPPVLLAARHARRLVEALALPAGADAEQARAAVRAAATVTELLRHTVAADIRAQRGIAAQRLVEHHGSQAAARAELGIAASTLSELLSGR